MLAKARRRHCKAMNRVGSHCSQVKGKLHRRLQHSTPPPNGLPQRLATCSRRTRVAHPSLPPTIARAWWWPSKASRHSWHHRRFSSFSSIKKAKRNTWPFTAMFNGRRSLRASLTTPSSPRVSPLTLPIRCSSLRGRCPQLPPIRSRLRGRHPFLRVNS